MFTYTPRNQLETYTLPDAGSGTAVERRVYDDSRRLEKVIRADGKEITFHYQPLSDRLSSIGSPRGTTAFDYDSTTGLVSEIVEPDGQKLEFEYEGLLLKRTTWTGEVNGSVGRTYDDNFRVTRIDVNGEDPIAYVYDGNVTTERTYTTFGEPESYTAKFSGAEIYYEHYTYNKLGWITDLERRQNGFNENLHYEYDDRGRLEEVWRDGVLESSYTYDDNSNRLSYTGPLGNATGTYDARDRMLSYGGATYTWSEAGELMTKTEGGQTTTYDYDVFGNLRKVELPNGIEIEYLTDGAQRRIGKKVNGVLVKQWLYQDQLEPVAELDGKGISESRFVFATGAHSPDYLIQATTAYRYLSDHLGSPRLVVNIITGQIVQELRIEEYGQVTLNTNALFQPFGFVGGIYEPELEMVRLGVRDYDIALGRWTTRDPLGFNGGNPNLFIYAEASPQFLLDIDGMSASSAAWGFTKGLGTSIAVGIGAAAVVAAAPAAGPLLVVAGAIGLATAYFEGEALYYDPAVSDDEMHEYLGEIAGGLVGCGISYRGYRSGAELELGPHWRFAPFGNTTGHRTGKYPHYHRRALGPDGSTVPGGSIKRHRPWDSRTTDRDWRDRF